MSKRSHRRLAVVAGAALAIGSMAPAMAQRVDVSGVADVDVSLGDDEVGSTALPGIPSTTEALYAVNGLNSLLMGDLIIANSLVKSDLEVILNKVTNIGLLDGDGLLECGLVNIQSCNTGGNHDINILSDGGPGNSSLGLGLLSPVTGTVGTVLGTVGLGGNGGLGSLLDPQVGVIAAVFASL